MVSGPFTRAQLARLLGITVREIQSYRDCGLLQPPRRRRGRTGDLAFHLEHVERLRFIKRALHAGYSLEDIARLVDPDALLTCRDVYEATVRCAEELRTQEPQRAESLAQLAEACPKVGGRAECPILSSFKAA